MFLVVSGWLAYGDITEILLKVASNTLKQTNRSISIITSISLKFHQKIVSTYLRSVIFPSFVSIYATPEIINMYTMTFDDLLT